MKKDSQPIWSQIIIECGNLEGVSKRLARNSAKTQNSGIFRDARGGSYM